ncbi:unnamed protein product [Rhizopus stolonifer]
MIKDHPPAILLPYLDYSCFLAVMLSIDWIVIILYIYHVFDPFFFKKKTKKKKTQQDTLVVVAYHDPVESRHKVTGDLGQIIPLEFDLKKKKKKKKTGNN